MLEHLFDGLDEVLEEVRDQCVAAINTYRTYRGEYHQVGMVVCSRVAR